MDKKERNEEIQSRREFFKNAPKIGNAPFAAFLKKFNQDVNSSRTQQKGHCLF